MKSSLPVSSSGSSSKEELVIEHVDDTSAFHNFYCGVSSMDQFIHGALEQSVKNHFCQLYSVTIDGEVVALFSLTFDSLTLDFDDKEELQITGSVHVPELYEEVFWDKQHYPALEISYLAVREDFRCRGLGKEIIEIIADKAASQQIGGCQFLTVEAYREHSPESSYSAIGFYHKVNFAPCEYPNPYNDTLRMFRPLYYKAN